ncbi:MAG TPA: PEGA domain-containing protein [Sandaracinaceae bacterium LLY-WYZ-13_1]|nr:PEGA domain-containing protein [Sandaracinaceae bacterium LLY-WYZ-13_1]
MRGVGTWIFVALVGVAPRAAAQAERERPSALVVVETGAPEATARRWRRRVEDALFGTVSLEDWARGTQPAGTVTPDRLEVVERVQRLLVRAKGHAARLRERDALADLARAEALAERHLEIPGMAAWYAEVQLAVALTAAQAGLEGLSDAALRRAASVDPGRGVQAAEARPEVVARGRAAVRAAVTGPRGRFEVRADAPGAMVFLDDRALGPAPRIVEAPVGPHVLRIDAGGHRGWARVVTVFEGDRPPVVVRLAPTARTQAARRARDAARAGRPEAVAAALAELGPRAPRVWLLWPGAGPRDRAVLMGCEPGGCGAVRRLDGDAPVAVPTLGESAADDALAAAHRWSAAPDGDGEPAPPWWERWYVWAAVGAVVGAAAAAVGVVAAQPGEDQGFDGIEVDASPWEPFLP